MLRRIIGFALLAVGVVGVILAIVGIIFGAQVVDGIGVTAKDSLALVSDTLNTTRATLEQTKATIQQAEAGLADVETTIRNVGDTVVEADPVVNQVLTMATTDVPDTLDAVNA